MQIIILFIQILILNINIYINEKIRNADTQSAYVPPNIYKGDSPLNCSSFFFHFILILIFIFIIVLWSWCHFLFFLQYLVYVETIMNWKRCGRVVLNWILKEMWRSSFEFNFLFVVFLFESVELLIYLRNNLNKIYYYFFTFYWIVTYNSIFVITGSVFIFFYNN